jgi:hypothetical protein
MVIMQTARDSPSSHGRHRNGGLVVCLRIYASPCDASTSAEAERVARNCKARPGREGLGLGVYIYPAGADFKLTQVRLRSPDHGIARSNTIEAHGGDDQRPGQS